MDNGSLTRRNALKAGALAATVAAALPAHAQEPAPKKNIKQCFSWGMYMRRAKDPVARIKVAAKIGFAGIERGPQQYWKAIRDAGMEVPIIGGNGTLRDAFCNPKNWDKNEKQVLDNLKLAEQHGIQRLLLLTGNSEDRSEAENLDNCTKFLQRVIKPAEQAKVLLCPELLNSKVNHAGYFLDKSSLGFALCKRIKSPMLAMLYDIYHMQIMEGDLIRTLTENIQYIGHFHTGGNPGRKDMDDQQEIYYPAVMRAIAATDYSGYVAHEFGPKDKDTEAAMRRNFAVCDI
jgi:hydroxypyruvate isomerase